MSTLHKWFLSGKYLAKHEENRMASEGAVAEARQRFFNNRFRNLDYLLRTRYAWMNDYLKPGQVIIEIGAGAGFSELYLKHRPILTDADENPWIDRFIDATQMDFADASVDVIIASHTVHHFYSPYKFFVECQRVLKKDGVVIIQEINTSFFMRLLLRIMRHEGWAYDVNVFDPNAIVNDANDLWSANCAVPELLFHDTQQFERTFPELHVTRNICCECLLFPLSGGVIAKTSIPELPDIVLQSIMVVDKVLTRVAPNIFALGRQVVLQRR